MSSQQGMELEMGSKHMLSAPPKQGVPIKIGILPNTSATTPSQEHSLGDERRKLDDTNTESTSFETPYLLRGGANTQLYNH